MAIKEEIVHKAGRDGIAIECVCVRLLKARLSITSNFVGQKGNYTAAFNSAVASVPAREYVFVLTGANARTGRRGVESGNADSKVLGAHDRDVLNENGKLLLGFAEDNKLALLNTFLYAQKGRVLHIPKHNRSRVQSRLDYTLIK